MTLDIQELKARLNVSEGRRTKVYLDSVGIPTIGVGRNLKDVGLYEDEIDYLLNNDIRRIQVDLDRALPWWRSMDPVRQSVLADMCFNLGINRLLKFTNTLRKMKDGDYQGAADGMKDSLWYSQVKGRAVELVSMMRTG